MSAIVTEILERLVSFWPANADQEAGQVAVGQIDSPATETRVDTPPEPVTITRNGISFPPVEVTPRYYRYLKGTATSDSGKVYQYTHRFVSDPVSDAAAQQVESADCLAEVRTELLRWLASDAAL